MNSDPLIAKLAEIEIDLHKTILIIVIYSIKTAQFLWNGWEVRGKSFCSIDRTSLNSLLLVYKELSLGKVHTYVTLEIEKS